MKYKWIQFKITDDQFNTICLPCNELEPGNIRFNYGVNHIEVNLTLVNSDDQVNEQTHPLEVLCSKNIAMQLTIMDTIVYQLRIENDEITIGPIVGFLMGEQYYYYHDRFLKDLTDSLQHYHETGGLFIVFKTQAINWEEQWVYGLYYDARHQKWIYEKLPLPDVIYRRTLLSKSKDVNKLDQLSEGKMFNRFKLDKYEVYQILNKQERFASFLPVTQLLKTWEGFLSFIEQHKKVILKPKMLSRGRGICVVDQIDVDTYLFYDYRDANIKYELTLSKEKLSLFLKTNNFFESDYIIQSYIHLAKIEGNLFDIRIVMQKEPAGNWVCTGSECRLAGSGHLLTNISLGGKALHVKEAIQRSFNGELDPDQAVHDLSKISQLFCEIMDENPGYFAEYGLDLAIDVNKKFWFIEGNFRPQFKGIKEIDLNSYYKICHTTIMYAVYLSGFDYGGDHDESI